MGIGSSSGPVAAEQIVERQSALKPSNLFVYIVGSQQIAHACERPNDAQGSAAGDDYAVQFMQHVRPRQVDKGATPRGRRPPIGYPARRFKTVSRTALALT
jgi:hypothetical protein